MKNEEDLTANGQGTKVQQQCGKRGGADAPDGDPERRRAGGEVAMTAVLTAVTVTVTPNEYGN